ncbi:MAG TPA: pilus assembly protein TadG-related protein [Kineosporiaceae bacterium]|nr:pilus assembly protein TadG-related protein [Kineosporiaceae bacterium]
MKRLRTLTADQPEAGAATVFVVAFAVVLLVMAGLVVDGGLAINARQRVADDVEQAARAGSQNLDMASLRNGGLVRIDPGKAQAAAEDFLARRDYPAGSVSVQADPARVVVSAEIKQKTTLLSLIFINEFTVRAQGQARPAVGITGEDIP